MSTRSMAARRRRAADRRKKRDTPAPRPAKLIPGPSAYPGGAAGAGASSDGPTTETARTRGRGTLPPLDRAAADDLRHTQELRLPPLAADPDNAGLAALPEADPDFVSDRAVTVRRYRDSSRASSPPSQPPRVPRPSQHQRPRDGGFSWRERDWGDVAWLRPLRTLPTLVISLVLLAAVLGGTFLLVTRTVGRTTVHLTSPFSAGATPTVRTQPVIVQPGTTGTTPTPAFPQYTIGVWAADPSPPGSGSDQIFARVSNNVMPAKGIVVTLSIVMPNGYVSSGPLVTDAHGLV
ncbi:MAG TPA: hypothetical protein VJQ45_04150, partial [Ktedonobacterales bacterium]|nr:hypothetical protein [Ktedonobacterales bacterium]